MEKNNFNLLLQNINTYAPNKISQTKNKFLNEVNYYLKESEDKKENNIKYPRISMSQRYQKNKPVLPIIKTNNIGKGIKLTHHVLTEANNKNTRNKIVFNWNHSNRNDFINFKGNMQKNFGIIDNMNYNNKYNKYKLSFPNGFNKYNIHLFKGAH